MTVAIYIKHYVTTFGMNFIINDWFPRIYSFMREQEGFLFFKYAKDPDDLSCCHFELQFRDGKAIDLCISTPMHDTLLAELEENANIRSVAFWEWSRIEDQKINLISRPKNLNWQRVEIVNTD